MSHIFLNETICGTADSNSPHDRRSAEPWTARTAHHFVRTPLIFYLDAWRLPHACCLCLALEREHALGKAPRDAAGGRQQRDQAGLQRVVDVGLAEERIGVGRSAIVELRMPAAIDTVDEAGGDEIPDAAVPVLEHGVAGRPRAAHGPRRCPRSTATSSDRGCAARRTIRACSRSRPSPCPSPRRRPAGTARRMPPAARRAAAAEFPELEQQAGPFQPVAGRRAIGAEHGAAGILRVEVPARLEMLGQPPARGAGMPVDDEVGDALGHAQILVVAGRLEGRHQRLGEVHVGVLPAIGPSGLQSRENSSATAPCCSSQNRVIEHLGDVGEEPVGVGMARRPWRSTRRGARRRGHRPAWCRRWVRHSRRPRDSRPARVAVAVPDEVHAVVDDGVRAGPSHQVGDGEAVDHAGRRMELARGPAPGRESRRHRASRGVEIVEATRGIQAVLEEIQQAVRLPQQPVPVRRQRGPVAGVLRDGGWAHVEDLQAGPKMYGAAWNGASGCAASGLAPAIPLPLSLLLSLSLPHPLLSVIPG